MAMKSTRDQCVPWVFILLMGIGCQASADTVNARCDIYPAGGDTASASLPCTFSQRQGYIHIQRQDGVGYQLTPVGDRPGNYVDQRGEAAYRNAGLGERGQIYRLKDETVLVYWDTYPFNQ
jgi:hypothetical protein